MFLALKAGEIDQRIVLEEIEAEKILSGTFVQPAVGTANLTRWLCQPACPRHHPALYLTMRVCKVDSLHADFYYVRIFWEGFGFSSLDLISSSWSPCPTLASCMHANATMIDHLPQLTIKKMRVLACVGNPTNRWGVNPKPKWTRDLLYI